MTEKGSLPSESGQAVEPSPTFMGLPYQHDVESLDIAVVGVPWDGGTRFRVGSRHGPREVRIMSALLHGLHPTFDVSPQALCATGDVGDVRILPFDQGANLARIEAFFRHLADRQVAPVAVGGDHLITLPILRAVARDGPLALVQIDAHSDTADASPDGDRYTSSTPFRRAIEEGLLEPTRVVQIGLRGTLSSREKMQWARAQGIRQISMDEMHDQGLQAVIEETRRVVGDWPTYVTVDIDGIDPAYAPGTGTPVVGGLTSLEAQRLLRGLVGAAVVGGDVTEISPPYDHRSITALLGASLMHEILCLVALHRSRGEQGAC